MKLIEPIRALLGLGSDIPDSAALAQELADVDALADKNRAAIQSLVSF